jgi:hypothetical protein
MLSIDALAQHPGMTYTVLVRIDEAGRWPVVVREDEELLSGDGARWRYVATADMRQEADRVRAALHEKHERGEL